MICTCTFSSLLAANFYCYMMMNRLIYHIYVYVSAVQTHDIRKETFETHQELSELGLLNQNSRQKLTTIAYLDSHVCSVTIPSVSILAFFLVEVSTVPTNATIYRGPLLLSGGHSLKSTYLSFHPYIAVPPLHNSHSFLDQFGHVWKAYTYSSKYIFQHFI